MAERVGQHGDCGCDHHTGFYDNGYDNGYNYGFDSYGFDSYGCCTAASCTRSSAPVACALIIPHNRELVIAAHNYVTPKSLRG